MPKRRWRWLSPLALALGSCLLTLLALEGAFRLLHVPVGTVQINRATVRRSANPRLRFELRPGSVARAEVEYRISGEGLRGPETDLGKPPGVRRVVVLGDSIAFGYWVAEKDTFARQLERLLNDEPGSEGRIEVLNFGVPGYNLEQETEVLRAKALAFAPDLVLFAFCLNDLEGVFSYELGLVQDRAARRESPLGRARDALLGHSVLFSWVEYRLAEAEARRSFAQARNPMAGPLYAEAVTQQERALRDAFSTVREILTPHAVPGAVAVFPILGGRFDRYPHRELHRAVVEAATASGLVAVDLLDCYSAYDFRDLRVDVAHPSPLGHRVAAHAVRDALCAQGLLCSSRPLTGPSCRDYRPADFPTVRGY